MKSIIHLRHLILSTNPKIDERFVRDLFRNIQSDELKSNFFFGYRNHYFEIEYFSSSIPGYLFRHPFLKDKEIITFYSSDLSFQDSFIILDRDQIFDYTPIVYHYDRIEMKGNAAEIKIFEEYVRNRRGHTGNKVGTLFEAGHLSLHSHNNQLYFSSQRKPYRLIQKECGPGNLELNAFTIVGLTDRDGNHRDHLAFCLNEMFRHPDLYSYGVESITFFTGNDIFIKAEWDGTSREWKYYQNCELWSKISNIEIVKRIRPLDIYKDCSDVIPD